MQQEMQVLTSYASVEWFTPPRYIDLVRYVFEDRGIELDPASHCVAQQWIQADRFWTKEDDLVEKTLTRRWDAQTVFLNPPYGKENGKSQQSEWSRVLRAKYEAGDVYEAILLINSTHGYKWYEDLWIRFPVCFVRDRIRFIKEDGSVGGQAKRGQTFLLMHGETRTFHRFVDAFSEIGRVILPKGWGGVK